MESKEKNWQFYPENKPLFPHYDDYLVQYLDGSYGVAIWQTNFFNTFGQGKVYRFKAFDK